MLSVRSDGVVIISEQAFARACVSMALAPFMSEVPVLYSGGSCDAAIGAIQRKSSVTAVLDIDSMGADHATRTVERLSSSGCHVVVLSSDDDPALSRHLMGRGARRVASKRVSGLDDVVQAVFDRTLPESHSAAVSVPLTHTQRRVMALFAMGSSCNDIGREMGVSPETVKTHLKRIRAKYQAQGVHLPSRADVYRVAVMSGTIV